VTSLPPSDAPATVFFQSPGFPDCLHVPLSGSTRYRLPSFFDGAQAAAAIEHERGGGEIRLAYPGQTPVDGSVMVRAPPPLRGVHHAFLPHAGYGGLPVARLARLFPRSVRRIHDVHAPVFFNGGQPASGVEHERGGGEIRLAERFPRARGRIRDVKRARAFHGIDFPFMPTPAMVFAHPPAVR